jgi:hypothetical protein
MEHTTIWIWLIKLENYDFFNYFHLLTVRMWFSVFSIFRVRHNYARPPSIMCIHWFLFRLLEVSLRLAKFNLYTKHRFCFGKLSRMNDVIFLFKSIIMNYSKNLGRIWSTKINLWIRPKFFCCQQQYISVQSELRT